jgi:hypothetical protein
MVFAIPFIGACSSMMMQNKFDSIVHEAFNKNLDALHIASSFLVCNRSDTTNLTLPAARHKGHKPVKSIDRKNQMQIKS